MIFKIARVGGGPVYYAARELKRCLEAMDPSLEVLLLSYHERRPDVKGAVWLGTAEDLGEALPPVGDPELDDAIAIDVDRGEGFITGANPRAVLIAAFRYLRELGAAWVRPRGGELLPRCDVLSRKVELHEVPSCRHRGVCIEGAVSQRSVLDMIDWLPRVGMNAYFNQFRIPATFYERWYDRQPDGGKKVELSDIEGLRDESVAEVKRRGLLCHAVGHGWTCEPFGIAGTGWDPEREHPVPEGAKKYLAKVNGKRELWGNIPLNTNLCYSNREVRDIVSGAVADYCCASPEIDFVHVWLADGMNNHCECENCVKKRPSDWYIELLNAIDEKMTARGLKTRVVFLMYCDLYWPPVEEKLAHPERFVLMFAPITRTYSASLAEAKPDTDTALPDYVRNRCELPSSVEENLLRLRQWKEFFRGDSFDFDYHYMWDHHKDVAHMSMNGVLFRDMEALRSLGLNGMMSCQNQRVWLPSGFGMAAMAAALWNDGAGMEEVAERYFREAFGPDGERARVYLEELSRLLVPPYFRGELPEVSAETAESFARAGAHIGSFAPVIEENLSRGLPEAQRRSWELLGWHGRLCALLAPAAEKRAEGDAVEAKRLFERFADFAWEHEPDYADALDVFELTDVLSRMFRG